jgi:hypothetical protein
MAMKKQSKVGNLTKNASQPHGGARNLPKMAGRAKTAQLPHSRDKSLVRDAKQGGTKNATPKRPPHMKVASSIKAGGTGYGQFTPPSASGADRFRATKNKGVLRTSGSGHMLGCKK